MKFIIENSGEIMNEKNNIVELKKSEMNKKQKSKKTENKKETDKKQLGIKVIVVAVVVFILIGVYFFISDRYTSRLSDATVIESGSYTITDDDGFPVSFISNDIITCESFSSRIFVLTKKMLTCLRNDGKPMFSETFTLVKPELTVSEKYGLVYDRASSKYFIFNTNGIVREGTTEDNRHVISATIDNKGNCAFSTKSDDSACRVYLVSKNGEVRYIWSCAEEYVVSLDISTDGKEILCGSIGAFNGDIITKLYSLNIKSEDKEKSFTVNGSGCVGVSFYGKDKAIVNCLDKRVVMDLRTEDGAPTSAEYTTDATFISSDFNGYTAVVTDKINSFDKDEITLLDKNNSVVYKSDIPKGVIDVRVIGKKVYCLTDDSVLYLSSKGKIKDEVKCESRADGIVISSSKAYYYTVGNLRQGF